MLVKAIVSFSGKISMSAGDVREIKDQYVLNDLIRAGYIEPEAQEAEIVEKPAKVVEKTAKKPATSEKKTTEKRTRKKKK